MKECVVGSVNDLYDVYKRFCQGHMLQYIHLGNGRIGIYILTLGQKGHKSYQRMCTERITTSFDVKVFPYYIYFYTDTKFYSMEWM